MKEPLLEEELKQAIKMKEIHKTKYEYYCKEVQVLKDRLINM